MTDRRPRGRLVAASALATAATIYALWHGKWASAAGVYGLAVAALCLIIAGRAYRGSDRGRFPRRLAVRTWRGMITRLRAAMALSDGQDKH